MHHPHHMLPSNKSGIVGIALTVLYVGLLIVLPFGGIIAGALEGGLGAFARNVARRETLQALGLSVTLGEEEE